MITSLVLKDLPAVMEIWLQGNLQAHNFLPDGYWQSFYDEVQQQITQAEVYVWQENDILLGFIGLSEDYIAGLFVSPQQQRQGIGKALLQYAQQRKKRLRLHVYAENQRAVQFYQQAGFVVTAQQEQDGYLEYEMQWQK